MSLNLNHLEAFCVLSETLSFSKTAKILLTSQPAISKKIKTLEHNLNCELFIRSKNKITLSKEGILLRDRVLLNYKELKSSLSKEKTENISTIKLGSIYEAGVKILVPALGKLKLKNKISHFDLTLKTSDELIEKLSEGQLDFILIHQIPSQKSIQFFEIYQDTTILIGPKNFSEKDFDKLKKYQ